MNKKAVVSAALLGLMVVGLGCAVLWRNMSRKYIARWDMPKGSTSAVNAHGNVCIVQHPDGRSRALGCADVHLFPGVYSAIGVNESTVMKWQDQYGFHSGGAAPDGSLLAPKYPILSRLAWTQIDPVYLQGEDLSALLEETKRISETSSDPAVKGNLDKLSALATEAQERSQVLRFFG
jgi:hypothetical protein